MIKSLMISFLASPWSHLIPLFPPHQLLRTQTLRREVLLLPLIMMAVLVPFSLMKRKTRWMPYCGRLRKLWTLKKGYVSSVVVVVVVAVMLVSTTRQSRPMVWIFQISRGWRMGSMQWWPHWCQQHRLMCLWSCNRITIIKPNHHLSNNNVY